MSDTLKRVRRLLLLIPPACRAAASGRGVPLERARRLTGARSEAEVLEDVRSIRELYDLAEPGEQMLTLEVEDGEVCVLYAPYLETPLALSLPEGAMLLGALRPYVETGPAVRRAAAKLRKAIPEALREAADQLVRGVDVAAPPPSEWAPALREAIDRRLEVTLDYRAVADGALAPRTVEPRLLLHRDGSWYLAAWNVAKGEEHLYRLDRVAAVQVGSRVFDRHRGPGLERYAKGRRLYFDSGAERDVTLRLSGAPARLARQHGRGRVTANPDGTATVVKRTSTGNHLAAVVLGHGGDMTVVGPPDVRADLRARVDRLRARYREAGRGDEGQNATRPTTAP